MSICNISKALTTSPAFLETLHDIVNRLRRKHQSADILCICVTVVHNMVVTFIVCFVPSAKDISECTYLFIRHLFILSSCCLHKCFVFFYSNMFFYRILFPFYTCDKDILEHIFVFLNILLFDLYVIVISIFIYLILCYSLLSSHLRSWSHCDFLIK